MKKYLAVCFLALFVVSVSSAQTDTPAVGPSSTFSATAQAIALPGGGQTVAGTVVGATFSITPNFALRNDNLLVPGGNLSGFYGGFNYVLPSLSNKLHAISSTIDGNHLQIYLTASAGIDRITAADATVQHYSFLAGGGLRYDPLGNKNFSINCEVRWAKLPGYANSTAIVSLSPMLRF